MKRRAIVPGLLLARLGTGGAHAELAPTYLRCEYRVDPIGIDVARPRLSWVVESRRRGERQTAYQVRVAGSEAALKASRGDLWDSVKVGSDETAHVPYGGRALASEQACWWQVRCWDRDGRPSAYSAPARWTMGLLHPADWKAQWIGLETTADRRPPTAPISSSAVGGRPSAVALPPSPFLRKSFRLRQPVRRATLYATALGLYEMRLNGRRVGDELFRPGWTDYRKRVY